MACSDNVVRAGLTVKYVDVQTLCKMLDYTGRPPQKAIFSSIQDTEDPYATIFKPPVIDFAVIRIEVRHYVTFKKKNSFIFE